MKILLIEDEEKAADYIKRGLSDHGFIVDIVHNGVDGFFHIIEYSYDVIILDIMLPKLDGWSLLKKIRDQGHATPVMMLTARDAIEDRVRGLNSGADDYLVKPFSFSELLARIHALLRRGAATPDNVFNYHELKIDLIKHKVFLKEMPVSLTPKEFALLAFFIQRQGYLLSRTLLAENIWDMHFDSDTNLVDVAVKRLRDKLKINGKNYFIHTSRGLGYVFEYRDHHD